MSPLGCYFCVCGSIKSKAVSGQNDQTWKQTLLVQYFAAVVQYTDWWRAAGCYSSMRLRVKFMGAHWVYLRTGHKRKKGATSNSASKILYKLTCPAWRKCKFCWKLKAKSTLTFPRNITSCNNARFFTVVVLANFDTVLIAVLWQSCGCQILCCRH